MDSIEEPLPTDLTAILARSVVAAREQEITASHRASTRRILIDWLGVALAGAAQPVARILQTEYSSREGAASIVGTSLRASIADAALINGAAGHALDYDDVQEFVGHPGAVVVPAALAVAEALEATADDFARAIIAGYDAARFVGTLAMPGHYDHGFHSTATVCTFGAAGAAAVLLRLGLEETKNAIGLAATQAAGLKCMFGTMAKPFHAGRAASAGIAAARLAARGMTANATSLEAEQGFLSTQAHQPVPNGWSSITFGDSLAHLLFKYHASCYLTHSTIEAIRSLVCQLAVTATDVVKVEIYVPPGHLKVCDIQNPRTGLEAKFSLRHVAALVLAGYDTANPDVFCDGLIEDRLVRNLRAKIAVQGELTGQFNARVKILLADGRSLIADADVSITTSHPAQIDAVLDGKFIALASKSISMSHAKEIVERSYQKHGLNPSRLLSDLK